MANSQHRFPKTQQKAPKGDVSAFEERVVLMRIGIFNCCRCCNGICLVDNSFEL